MFGRPKPAAKMARPPAADAPLLIPGSPACEVLASDLAERFALLQLTGTALESQQLDEAEKQAALDEVKETIADYDKEHPATGPLHVYILDGKAAAGTDDEGAATLKALVAHAMTSPERTVAALIPEDENIDTVEKLHPATMLAALTKTVLANESITVLVGQPALEEYLSAEAYRAGFNPATDGILSPEALGEELSPATEGFGDVIKAFRRTFSSKAPHPDGLPKSPHLDVSNVVAGQYKKTYLNPSWVKLQKLVTGPISGAGIIANLQIDGKMPTDPIAAVNAGAQAIKAYVTNHAGAMQQYLTAAMDLINAHASATDPKVKAEAAQKLMALPSPYKTDDTKALQKVPGMPSVHESEDDAQVHPSNPEDHKGQLPALTADQIGKAAQTVLATMEEAYELSRQIASHLQVFNQLVDLSHNQATVAKLDPAVAKQLAVLAKGKGVWIMFDYCSMLLVQASALERWCYRSVGKKDLQASNESRQDAAVSLAMESGVMVAASVFGLMALLGHIAKRRNAKRSAADMAENRHLREYLKDKYGNTQWLAKQSFRTGNVPAEVIAKHLGHLSPTEHPAAVATQTLHGVQAWVKAYSPALEAHLSAIAKLGQSHGTSPMSDEEVLALGAKLEAMPDPLKSHPFHGQGFLHAATFEPSSLGTDLAQKRPAAPNELPALNAAEVKACAEAIEDLLQTADAIQEKGEQLSMATFDIREPDTGDEDDRRDFHTPVGQAQSLIWASFHGKDLRRKYCWVYDDLQKALKEYAIGLGAWIDASIEKGK